MTKPLDSIRVAPDYHAFLHFQCTGGSYCRAAIGDVLDDTEPASSNIRKTRDMAQVGDTDTILYSHFKYTGPLGGLNISAVNVNGYIMQHVSPRYLT